ncbi:recombinase family protein [Nocardioides humilatus]|uniref:Recombinase family protein n=1 Tax=Nocardioides humilatus TaxID=2607660 RepID=A0A5B1LKN2_9ACTN|nr:recombinase family protein [Nocardioides humilatus]KAA1421252.1 recombinase family protein [Nocardioides humilatus]
MSGQVVAYIRVSSDGQNAARQHDVLAGADRIFEDHASGKTAKRPALTEMIDYLRDGDLLRVASMDRLARNLLDLRTIVTGLTGRGIQVEFVKERLTFTGNDSPMSVLLLNLLGAVAEFERTLIRERQAEGIAIARAKGIYRGRARALGSAQIAEARQRVADGVPKSAVARDLGVARQTLYNALATSLSDDERAVVEPC